jgi:xanthine dehydrogenase accessory factor
VTGMFDLLAEALRAEEPVALAEVVEGPDGLFGAKMVVRPGASPVACGSLGDADLDRVVQRDALGELAAGLSVTRHYGRHGEARGREVSVFIESFATPPHMVIFGAVDFTAALAKVAKILGYRVTVCDARPVFATRARFPMADEVVVSWPDKYLAQIGPELGRRDAVCVLTHDPKFDVPAIVGAVATNVGYLGAMGSRRTSDERDVRLRQAGLTEDQLLRVMAPIGLDVGARTPEETAVAICAEIIALRTGRVAPSLRDGEGPIHRDLESAAVGSAVVGSAAGVGSTAVGSAGVGSAGSAGPAGVGSAGVGLAGSAGPAGVGSAGVGLAGSAGPAGVGSAGVGSADPAPV